MTHRVQLYWLPLCIAKCAAEHVRPPAAEHVEAAPELRRAHLICNVLEHPNDLATSDLVEHLPAELRVVALLIDGIAAITDDRDSAIRRRDEIIPRGILVA